MSSTVQRTSPSVRSLYRSLLRETNKLPYEYLRIFFRVKFSDDIRSDLRSNSRTIEISDVKRRRLEKELKRLETANSGKHKAFNRILDYAYGRRGKLKWELLEPFVKSENAEQPRPLIRGVETSRPPLYTPELKALLTSPSSRTTKPLKDTDIALPPTLPPRANPSSREAKLLGPFSKRREVNMRWRYFANETRKVLPPLEINSRRISRSDSDDVEVSESSRRTDILEKGLPEGGFQGDGILHQLQSLAGLWDKDRPLTRREQKMVPTNDGGLKSEAVSGEASENINANSELPTNFLRRRHRYLLRKIPILTWSEHEVKSIPNAPRGGKGKYEVSLPRGALSPTRVLSSEHLPFAGESNMAWIRHAQELDEQQKDITKIKQ